MKMIASSRLKAAQTKMERGRPFYEGAFRIMESIPASHKEGKNLVIAIAADRGLCGGINSSVAKYVKELLKHRADSKVITVGEKAAALIGREMGDRCVGGSISPKYFMQNSYALVIESYGALGRL